MTGAETVLRLDGLTAPWQHLMSLNDDLLKDIGISRCEIEVAVGRGRYDGRRNRD